MRIDRHQHARDGIRAVLAPDVRPAQEETLLRGQAVNRWRLFPGHRADQRHVRDPHSTVVGGVLAQGQLAVELQIVHRHEAAVLVLGALGALFELLLVVGRPPVAQVAVRVELTALVVEAVGQFVADNCPDRAKVQGIVGFVVIKRRLQDPRRKRDVVLVRVVTGVHRHRRIRPVSLIERFADLVEPPQQIVSVGALRVSESVAPDDLQGRIVAQFVGIADAVGDGRQFHQRLFLGLFAHPRKRLDVLTQRGFQLFHHGQRAGFAVRAEGLLHVDLANRFAQIPVGIAHTALPPRTQFLCPLHRLAEEFKVLVHERRRQYRSVIVHHVPAQVRLPIVQRKRVDHILHLLDEVRLRHVQRIELGRSHAFEIHVPAEPGAQGGKFLASHLVVNLLRIAPAGLVQRALGQAGFNVHHRLGFGRGFLRSVPQQLEHLLYVRNVLLAEFHGLGIVLEVVVAIGQTQPALIHFADDLAGILEVRTRAEAEHDVRTFPVQASSFLGQIGLRFHPRDALEVAVEWLRPGLLHRRLVHAGGVVVADLLLVAAAPGLVLRRLFQDRAHHVLAALLQ